MKKTTFGPSDIPADDWGTSEEAAKFANKLACFIENGFKRGSFSKDMYRTLSYLFGHIAHYSIHGFYQTWFETTEQRVEFLRHTTLQGGGYGPRYNVERAIQRWVRSSGVLLVWEQKLAEETRKHELATLGVLKAKYEPVPSPPSAPLPQKPKRCAAPRSSEYTQVGLFG